MYFDELDLNDDILDALDTMNFVECTPVQERAIPLVLEGRDLLASAQTGTGKTAAYLLPILEHLSRGGFNENRVNALILVPTRELAQQVDQLLAGFAYYQNTSWFAVYGGNDGVAFAQQQRALLTGGDIAIATPGRLLALLRTCKVDLSGIEFLVLDEADRMLDIGFYDDIMEIIGYLPKERQTLMFSATFPHDVEMLARKVLHNPAEVKISVSKPAEGIRQGVYMMNEIQKIPLLISLFNEKERGKSIIFLSSKQKVRDLYFELKRKSTLKVAQIHSDLDNAERSKVLLDFKNGKINVLVATDVVSRGIDIDDIELVVNYDVPLQIEDYVHRVGRTARAGAEGEAITLVTAKDKFRFDRIEEFIDKHIDRYELPADVAALAPKFEEHAFAEKADNKKRRGGKRGNYRGGKNRGNHSENSGNHRRGKKSDGNGGSQRRGGGKHRGGGQSSNHKPINQ